MYVPKTAILEIIILLCFEITNSKVIISKPIQCYIITKEYEKYQPIKYVHEN